MAIRQIWGFTHLPSVSFGTPALPEFSLAQNPYGITKQANVFTRTYINGALELTLSLSQNGVQTPAVQFACTNLTDGTSVRSIIGFRMYHGEAASAFINIGGLSITPAECGIQIDIQTKGIEIVWDRVKKTVSVFVNNILKLTKTIGGALYTPGSVIVLSTTYSNASDAGSQRRFSNFYFIDDTQDDTICDRLGNPSTVLFSTPAEDNTGWVSSTGGALRAVLNQIPAEASPATVYSPTIYPSTTWGPVKITHASTIPKYSSVFAVQSVFSIRRSTSTTATLDISYADSDGTKAAPSLVPQYGVTTTMWHVSMRAVETNSQNKEWTVDQANNIAIIFQQRDA